jgi:hypothetical protein
VKAPDRSTARDSLRSSVRRAVKTARLPCGAYVVGGQVERPAPFSPTRLCESARNFSGEWRRTQRRRDVRLHAPVVEGRSIVAVGQFSRATSDCRLGRFAKRPDPTAEPKSRFRRVHPSQAPMRADGTGINSYMDGLLTRDRYGIGRTTRCTAPVIHAGRCTPHYVTRTSLTATIRQARSHASSLSSGWCPCGRRGECPCFLRLDATARRAVAVAASLRTRPAGTVHRSPNEGPP